MISLRPGNVGVLLDGQPNKTIRGYELFEPIGEGGFSVVYHAYQPAVSRHVAVKVIQAEHANNPEFARRFESEAQLIAQLEHLHIVPLYDYWRDPDGTAYIIMREMRGGSLRQALEDGPWPLERVARLMAQVIDALALAHRRGIIHRDLKPGNILLDEACNAYLCDFGIAKELGRDTSLMGDGTILGSGDYIAPEQIQGRPATPQTDIYSLGIILYQLLTGRHPFSGTSPAGMPVKQSQASLPPLAIEPPALSLLLDGVLQKATAREPSQRFVTVQSMLEAFRRPMTESTTAILASQESTDVSPAIAARTPEATRPGLRMRFLGGMQINLDGRSVIDDLPAKALALVCYLAVTGEAHTRSALAGLLWSDFSEHRARSNLRDTVAVLRRSPVAPYLEITRRTIRFNVDSSYRLDVDAFQNGLEVGYQALPADSSGLEKAVTLYDGEFLAGFQVAKAALFEEWITRRSQQLDLLAAEALQRLVDHHLDVGRYDGGIDYAYRLLNLDPWREEAHRNLMLLLMLKGDHDAALRQYEKCRQILADELGVDPSEKTQALYENIRRQMDHDGAEKQIRLAPGGSAQPGPVAHNIPGHVTPFVGRQLEQRAIDNALGDPSARLITIFGVGGSGKTRLALAIAEKQVQSIQRDGGYRFPDGVFFAALQAVESPSGIVPALCQAVGFQPADQSRDGRSAEQQLIDYLRRRQLLLVIDNFEQLMDGVQLLARIHRTAPDLHILVTSRQKLALHGERLYGLQGLSYPENMELEIEAGQLLADYSAADLFAVSARRINPEFKLRDDETKALIELCQLVEGLPLAMELAAGWTNVLSIKDIVAQLEEGLSFLESDLADLPDRHRSMEAVFEVTWRRLPDEERRLFCQLCVFLGGFTRQAAAEVAGASLRQLAALANKALVQYDKKLDRYEIHRLLHQYGADKLTAYPAAGDQAHERHCAYFCTSLARWNEGLKGSGQLAALAEMETESANARAAWRWAIDDEQPSRVDQAADGLSRFYLWRRRYHQGQEANSLAQEAITRLTAAGQQGEGVADLKRIRAKVMLWQSVFCEQERADLLVGQALQMLESPEVSALDARREMAFALQRAGDLAFDHQPEIASRHYLHSLSLYRELDDTWGTAKTLTAAGWLAAHHGEVADAQQCGEEALALSRKLGDCKRAADALWLLGTLAIVRLDAEEARLLFGESLDLRQKLGDHITDIVAGPLDLGMTLTWIGRLDEAVAVREETLALYEAQGQPRQIAMAHVRLGTSMYHSGDFEGSEYHSQIGLEQCRQLADYRGAGLALFNLGVLAVITNANDRAEQFLLESIAYLRQVGDAVEVGWSLAVCAEAVRRLGRPLVARQYLYEAFTTAHGTLGMITHLAGLTTYINLLLDDGRNLEAVEMDALLQKLPFVRTSKAISVMYETRLEAVNAALPPEQVIQAEIRGRARDFDGTAAEILAELEKVVDA